MTEYQELGALPWVTDGHRIMELRPQCQEPGVWGHDKHLPSTPAGSLRFKPSSTRKQAAFHSTTIPPFHFLKERGHWSDLVICGKNSGWGGSIKRKHCTAQMGNTTKAMW